MIGFFIGVLIGGVLGVAFMAVFRSGGDGE